MSQCTAKTKSGSPCKARAQQGSTLCYRHDPAKREEAIEASAKGGTASRGSRTINLYLDGQLKGRFSTRDVAAKICLLLEELELLDGLGEDLDRLVRAKLRGYNSLMTAIKQVHTEEGTMPPLRIELETTAREAAAEMPTEVLLAMKHAAERQLH